MALKALYHLNDVYDTSGNGITLSNVGTMTFVSGKFGNCAKIESGKYLRYAARLVPQIQASYFCWVKLSSEIGANAYQIMEDSSGATGYQIKHIWYEYNGGTRRLVFATYGYAAAGGSDWRYLYYPITLGTSNWYYIGATFGASGTPITGYVNGAKIGVSSNTYAGASPPSDTFGIGSTYAGGSYLLGYIDEFVVYDNEQKSQSWVAKQYASGIGRLL